MRRGLGIGAAVGLALMTTAVPEAGAQTPPLPGAYASPVPVPAPFPAGSTIRILSGYGPSKGSSLHADTDACCKANDHYALDLVYEGEANYGLGLPIVAPFAGEVIRAGWATSGWANYGLRVILRHDLGDGNVYHTLYAHLNAIDPAVVEGGMVAAGQVLGELGQSCQEALSCGSFSTPHLHWAMHRNSTVGGSGTGGSYGGNAVVPEPFSGYEDLLQNDILMIGEPVCGDGTCSGGEDSGSCPQDCPSCVAIGPAGRIIEENDLCFVQSGSPQYWYDAEVGSGGALLWTHAVDAAQADDSGRWNLVFEQSGSARVEAYIEPGFASSMQARYFVSHAEGIDEVVVNQGSQTGWVELGAWDFVVGGDHWIRLDDNTGEQFSDMRVLAFDAMRVEPLDVGGGDTGPGGETDTVGDATMGDETVGPVDPTGNGDDVESSGTGATSGGGALTGFPNPSDDGGGCACTTGSSGGAGWWLLMLLGVPLRRRRGR